MVAEGAGKQLRPLDRVLEIRHEKRFEQIVACDRRIFGNRQGHRRRSRLAGGQISFSPRGRRTGSRLAAELRAAHRIKIEVIELDLAADGAPKRLFEEVGRRGLSVDLLVNNAGFGKWGHFLDDDRTTYAEMMSLNMRAVVELCHLFLPSMAAKGDCGILNVGSTASFIPVRWSAVYGATKAFVLSFSEALAYE
jgi:short-subunit dehydrogenase